MGILPMDAVMSQFFKIEQGKEKDSMTTHKLIKIQ